MRRGNRERYLALLPGTSGRMGMAQSCSRGGSNGHWDTFLCQEDDQTLEQAALIGDAPMPVSAQGTLGQCPQ